MPYEPIIGMNADLDRVQYRLRDAFAKLEASIRTPGAIVTFMVNGNNGIGNVRLAAIKGVDGKVTKSAVVGMRVLAAWNLTDLTDVQTSFETTLSASDQVKQTATTNLSAKRIGFVLTT